MRQIRWHRRRLTVWCWDRMLRHSRRRRTGGSRRGLVLVSASTEPPSRDSLPLPAPTPTPTPTPDRQQQQQQRRRQSRVPAWLSRLICCGDIRKRTPGSASVRPAEADLSDALMMDDSEQRSLRLAAVMTQPNRRFFHRRQASPLASLVLSFL